MQLGDYHVLSEIGRGGMGVVYRAQARDGREVAVKVVRADKATRQAVERFQREERLLAALTDKEGFVPLLGSGSAPGGAYLVMPFVPGGTLRHRLRKGALAVEEAVLVARTVARAVGRAHAQGIVHRDLKPENLLF